MPCSPARVFTEHGRLSEVVAYEPLVESIDERPIDTPTVLRACGYVGLPVVSWFGRPVTLDVVIGSLASLAR